jgi:hypothetical protein
MRSIENMKKFIFLFGLIVFDSCAAVMCRSLEILTFHCLPTISSHWPSGSYIYPGGHCASGSDCYTGANDGNWNVIGPWGSGGTNITLTGYSRCSTTKALRYAAGYPAKGTGSGTECWGRIKGSDGNLGPWVFLTSYSATECATGCAGGIAGNAGLGDSGYRRALLCAAPSS